MAGSSLKRVVIVRESTRSYRDVDGRGGQPAHTPVTPGQTVPGKVSFTTSSPVLYIPARVARAVGLDRPQGGGGQPVTITVNDDGSFTVRLA